MEMALKRALLTGLACSGAVFASTVSAGPIQTTVNSITGEWSSVTGGTDVTGLNTNEIRWGDPFVSGGDQSGYRFDGDPPSGPQAVGSSFDLGTFTHFNEPIFAGGSITAATLDVTIEALVENGSSQNVTLTSQFVFSHNETPNNPPGGTCANGEPNNQGVNINGCADILTPITNPEASQTVTIDGNDYLFSTTGFDVGSSFETVEESANTAQLQGEFIGETQQVPVPSTLGLLGAGLAGLGFVARRRRNA